MQKEKKKKKDYQPFWEQKKKKKKMLTPPFGTQQKKKKITMPCMVKLIYFEINKLLNLQKGVGCGCGLCCIYKTLQIYIAGRLRGML